MTQPPNQQPVSSQPRPGQMTAVMRAVAASGPKVLRIGMVHRGRVVEERIIKQRGHVTVGPSEKNVFVVAAPNITSSFRLFEIVGTDYCLNFTEGMSGRVALPTGISDLAALKGQAKKGAQGAYQIRLTEDSRGKVVLGDTTFLFQFVAPPPVQPKPQLPVAVTRGTSSIDWGTTIIAAFSFLLHFLAIGSLYSDWLDPVVDDEVNVASLIDSMKSLPPPPPVEDKPDDKPADTKDAAAPQKEAAKAANKAPEKAAGAMSAKQAAALTHDLDQLEMATLGALTSAGPATAGVLKAGEVATSALDQAAASSAGVGAGAGDLKIGSSGGALKPGQVGGGLGSIGATTAGGGGTGTAKAVSGPKGNASVGGANVSGGNVSNAARTVAGMRAGFRACYQRGLNENPDAAGSIGLTIRVGPGGEVLSVSAKQTGTISPAVVACVQARAKSAQFSPPDGGSAVVMVPVTFVKQ